MAITGLPGKIVATCITFFFEYEVLNTQMYYL